MGGWLTPRSGRFTPRYPLYRRLGRPQDRSRRVRKMSPHAGIFFPSLFLLYPHLFLSIECPGFLPFILIVHHTQHKHPSPPGGIRSSNPSKRAVSDPRLRPLGFWERIRSPDRPARSVSLYRLSYPGQRQYPPAHINV
jgi:hypothetical protein